MIGVPRVAMFSKKVIPKGEEVTFNYGSDYDFMNCQCAKCLKEKKKPQSKPQASEKDAKPAARTRDSPHEGKAQISVHSGQAIPEGLVSYLDCTEHEVCHSLDASRKRRR